jgi:hypothetical protein
MVYLSQNMSNSPTLIAAARRFISYRHSQSSVRACLFLFLIIVPSKQLAAQWSVSGQLKMNPTRGPFPHGGCMTFATGFVWAADENVVLSADSGRSWRALNFSVPSGSEISSIQAYDQNTCVLAVNDDGIYLTHDQGSSWSKILTGDGSMAGFLGSANDIIASASGPRFSHDGGVTWQSPSGIPQFGEEVFWWHDRLALALGFGAGRSIATSQDRGVNWTDGAALSYDSYSFVVDTCDPTHYWVMSERSYNGDGLSSIVDYTNNQTNFRISATHPQPYYCGSLTRSEHALYCQTLSYGVERSTDEGMSWSSIGGPPCFIDSRLLMCLSDNLVIGVDQDGIIWRTTNSGGDSIRTTAKRRGALVTFPDSILSFAPATGCSASSLGRIDVVGVCGHANVSSVAILGVDSLHYVVTHQPATPTLDDSVSIMFTGDTERIYNAQVLLQLDDGTSRIVQLSALGAAKASSGVRSFILSADSLLSFGASCENHASILISRLCGSYNVANIQITGADSSSFRLIHGPGNPTTSFDSIALLFVGDSLKYYFATLEIHFDDGTSHEIRLIASGSAHARLATHDVLDDTVGGKAYIPIILRRTGAVSSATLTLRYDPASWAVYQGSFSRSGYSIENSLYSGPGSAVLNITGEDLGSSDSIVGYAVFTLFPQSDTCATIKFDSLQLTFPYGDCSVQFDSSASAKICTHGSNGNSALLTLTPNPASTQVRISANADLGLVSIEARTSNGGVVLRIAANIGKGKPATLDVSELSSGKYFLTIRGASIVRTLPLIIIR